MFVWTGTVHCNTPAQVAPDAAAAPQLELLRVVSYGMLVNSIWNPMEQRVRIFVIERLPLLHLNFSSIQLQIIISSSEDSTNSSLALVLVQVDSILTCKLK